MEKVQCSLYNKGSRVILVVNVESPGMAEAMFKAISGFLKALVQSATTNEASEEMD